MIRIGIRGIILIMLGIFLLILSAWLSDIPLLTRAAVGLLGLVIIVVAVWGAMQPTATTNGSGIVQGYRVSRAAIPGVFLLVVPFGLPDEPLWKRAGMVLLGIALLVIAFDIGGSRQRS